MHTKCTLKSALSDRELALKMLPDAANAGEKELSPIFQKTPLYPPSSCSHRPSEVDECLGRNGRADCMLGRILGGSQDPTQQTAKEDNHAQTRFAPRPGPYRLNSNSDTNW